jgi:hypothetical protein
MRVKRGKLEGDKEGNRLFVWIDTDQTADPTADRDELLEAYRDQIAFLRRELERRDQLLAAALSRIPELDRPPEARESPEMAESPGPSERPFTDEEGPRGGAEKRSAEDATSVATYPESPHGRYAPVDRLPVWQNVIGVFLSMMAYPFGIVVILISFGRLTTISRSGFLPYELWLPTSLLAMLVPAIYGYWVGRKLTSLRFWRRLAPVAVLIATGSAIATLSFAWFPHLAWVISGGGAMFRLALSDLQFSLSSGALYLFGALLGNARQRRNRDKLAEERLSGAPSKSAAPVQGWSPRQQALVGLAGTFISALTALVGLIGTILMVMGGGNGG